MASFTENLKPGLTYQVVNLQTFQSNRPLVTNGIPNFQVVVKTVSGSVASWPATGNVTTRPLPVLLPERPTHVDDETKEVTVNWEPNTESHQDQYKVGCDHSSILQGTSDDVPCFEIWLGVGSHDLGQDYILQFCKNERNYGARSIKVQRLRIKGFIIRLCSAPFKFTSSRPPKK